MIVFTTDEHLTYRQFKSIHQISLDELRAYLNTPRARIRLYYSGLPGTMIAISDHMNGDDYEIVFKYNHRNYTDSVWHCWCYNVMLEEEFFKDFSG